MLTAVPTNYITIWDSTRNVLKFLQLGYIVYIQDYNNHFQGIAGREYKAKTLENGQQEPIFASI